MLASIVVAAFSLLLPQTGAGAPPAVAPGQAPPAQDAKPQARPTIPTDTRPGRLLRLSLEDCLGLGDIANVDLTLSRLDELLAREDENLADSVFEPEFFATAQWRRSESPRRSDFQPSVTSTVYSGSFGLRKRVITGGTLELAFNPTYVDQTVQSAFSFPTTYFTGEMVFTASQPLLRGAWIDYTLADLEAARLERIARMADHDRARQTVLDAVVNAYYVLIFRREDYIVRFQGLELSREQLRNTEEKIRLGELAPRDRIADQADVAKKEEELITAENAILDAEDALRRLILPFRQEAAWDVVIVPTDELGESDPELAIPEVEAAFRLALGNRPDLQASRRRADAVDQQMLKAERDLLPGLDLTAIYSADAQRDNFNGVQKDVFNADYPDYLLRLGLVLPIGNLAARSNYNKAKLQAEAARRNVQILTIDIQKEVREALRRVVTARKVIAAARESVRLAQNNLDAERTRLQLGDQTQFEVQRRNQELQDARSRLIQSRLDYRAAWFHLLAVQGQLSASSRLPHADREEGGK